MSDYKKLVQQEAKNFFESIREEFEGDDGEHGGKSERANLMQWIDESGKLTARIEEVTAKWGNKEVLWVETHTRNRAPQGGDRRGNAFGSFLQDIRHAIKKLAKS